MSISNLPRPGAKFLAKNNISSFSQKLKSACRYGDLKNLQDNIPAIIQIVDRYEKYIRGGRFSYRQKMEAMHNIRKIDKKLTKEDLREIDKILDHLRS